MLRNLTSFEEISSHIRKKIIYEGLELEELGIGLDEITDDVLIFEEAGLNLDSVDALDIIAGVQRDLGLTFSDVDQAFIDENCATISLLTKTVQSLQKKTVEAEV